MGNIINTVAFPVPALPLEFYDGELLRRSDLVWLNTTEYERIPACYVRAPSRRTSFLGALEPGMTLLYSHGNAEDLGLHLDYIEELSRKTGADVLSYEYVGYSLSRINDNAEPSEAGCIRSVDAAWRYCVDYMKIHPSRIIIFGRSIGSGPAVDLASRENVSGSAYSPWQVGGVLLQSPLESGARAIFGPVVSWVGYRLDIFKNYEKIEHIRAPVAIMHGTADEVVPVANGMNLYALCTKTQEPLWLEDFGHNNMPRELCFEYTRDFVARVAASAVTVDDG